MNGPGAAVVARAGLVAAVLAGALGATLLDAASSEARARNGLIAYSQETNRCGDDDECESYVWTVRPNAQGRRRLPCSTAEARRLGCADVLPVFSPGGGRLATAANAVEYVEVGNRLLPKDVLAVRDPDGRVRNTITRINQGVTALAWSGDATRLAFAAFRGIYIVRPDGTGQERFAKVRGGDLAWSRQGRLAWTPRDGGLIAVTNKARTQVRRLAVAGTSVAWSPDGRRLAYTTVDDGDDVTRTVGADGRRRRTVTRRCDGIYGTTLSSVGSAIKWSPDGRQLLCTTSDRRLIAVNIRTGRTRIVAGGPNLFIIRSFDWQRAPRGR